MLTELSLNVLDIAENSVRAGASLIEIELKVQRAENRLSICIRDNGCGMDEAMQRQALDPFYTSRSTRRVGLGLPFFREAALLTGGDFRLSSEPGRGTQVLAVFVLDSIDRMPLGDMDSTIHNLIVYHPKLDFIYRFQLDTQGFCLDTREMRRLLDGMPLDAPEVSAFLREYLAENHGELCRGVVI